VNINNIMRNQTITIYKVPSLTMHSRMVTATLHEIRTAKSLHCLG